MEQVKLILERWARWRIFRAGNELGWPKRDSIGRAMSGMPSTKCIVCNGKGRVTVNDADKHVFKIECAVCGGKGKIAMDPDPNKANPAYIHSTKGRNFYDDDPTSQKVDFIVCTELTEDERSILLMEYTRVGTQNHKISRLRVTHSYYNSILVKAEKIIEEGLTLYL